MATPSPIIGGNGTWQGLNFRFTDFSVLAGSDTAWYGSGSSTFLLKVNDVTGTNSGPVVLRDCQLHGGGLAILLGYISNESLTISMTNNLLERVNVAFWENGYMPNQLLVNMRNNLFYGGTIKLTYYYIAPPSAWFWFNNVFDSVVLTENGGYSPTWYTNVVNGWNAYYGITLSTPLTNSMGHDQGSTVSSTYFTGPLGNYYSPSSYGTFDAGSTNANLLGLYHYTTRTNQLIEANSIVDIGYHYVATDANGNPIDTDGDGTPDYLEDSNGNGVFDGGDLGDWLINAYNGLSAALGLQVFTPLK